MANLASVLEEYVHTVNNPDYGGDINVINSKFPELANIDPTVLEEYVYTANNPGYAGNYNIINGKFPELFGGPTTPTSTSTSTSKSKSKSKSKTEKKEEEEVVTTEEDTKARQDAINTEFWDKLGGKYKREYFSKNEDGEWMYTNPKSEETITMEDLIGKFKGESIVSKGLRGSLKGMLSELEAEESSYKNNLLKIKDASSAVSDEAIEIKQKVRKETSDYNKKRGDLIIKINRAKDGSEEKLKLQEELQNLTAEHESKINGVGEEERKRRGAENMPVITEELIDMDDSESLELFYDKYRKYGFQFSVGIWGGDEITVTAPNN